MKRWHWTIVVAAGLLAGGAQAATKTYELTITGTKEEQRHVPVRVPLAVPPELAAARSVQVRVDGQTIDGQLTAPSLLAQPVPTPGDAVARELHFILPHIKAGQTLAASATLATEPSSKAVAFRWHDTPGKFTELRFGDRPVLRYLYQPLDDSSKESREQTYKVFHHVFDPSGARLVTKGAGGQYTHHRGLFYGFNRVTYGDGKKCDVWHCGGDAHQSHQKFLSDEEGPVLGRHRLAIHWHGVGKEVFAEEERELTAYHVPGGILIEFASRLKPVISPVHLDGDPQHAGFHFRADNEVASKTNKQTIYIRPTGADKPGATRNWPQFKDHVNLPWNAMSFVLGDQRYTVCYLDRPDNPKEARFSERDYGRLGSYFVHELTEQKPLDVNYRVWLQEGQMDVPEVAAHSARFVQPPRVTVK
ncbi:MAG: DUF6807 family protein [Gemmataceae bacterium]